MRSTREAISIAAATVHASAVPGTRIIAVSCESTNPDIAAGFLNALATDYAAQSSEICSVNAQKTAQWLAWQIDETKARLGDAERKLQDFERKTGVAFIGEQQTLADAEMQ